MSQRLKSVGEASLALDPQIWDKEKESIDCASINYFCSEVDALSDGQ